MFAKRCSENRLVSLGHHSVSLSIRVCNRILSPKLDSSGGLPSRIFLKGDSQVQPISEHELKVATHTAAASQFLCQTR